MTSDARPVLVVDDQPSVLEVTALYLETMGYSVQRHPDPVSALEAVLAAPATFQLVITDFSMPAMDGLELAEQIWEKAPEMPIVFMTGFGDDLARRLAGANRPAALLAKPFRRAELVHAIETARP